MADIITQSQPILCRKRYIYSRKNRVTFVSVRTFSQMDANCQTDLRQPVYPYPTATHSQWTTNVQQLSSLTNTGDPGMSSLEPSIAQLEVFSSVFYIQFRKMHFKQSETSNSTNIRKYSGNSGWTPGPCDV